MKQGTEQKILDAAETLFLEQGFKSTTTAQIAKKAGCNQALVHYYFHTKEQLFERIYIDKIRLMVSNILNCETPDDSFESCLRHLIDVHWNFLTQNPTLVRFTLREVLGDSAVLKELLVNEVKRNLPHVFKLLEEKLTQEIQAGRIRPISTFDLLLTIFSLNVVPFVLLPF